MLTAGMQPLGVTALLTHQAQVISTCSKSHSLQPANARPAGLGALTANSAATRNRYEQQVRKRTLLLTAPAIAIRAAATECCCTPARPPTHTTRHAQTQHTHAPRPPIRSCKVSGGTRDPAAGTTTDKQSVTQPRQPLGEGTHKAASALTRDHHKPQCPAATRCTQPGTGRRGTPLPGVRQQEPLPVPMLLLPPPPAALAASKQKKDAPLPLPALSCRAPQHIRLTH